MVYFVPIIKLHLIHLNDQGSLNIGVWHTLCAPEMVSMASFRVKIVQFGNSGEQVCVSSSSNLFLNLMI